MRIDVTVDHTRCAGTGNCVEIAPQSFELNEEGYAVPTPPYDSLSSLRDAEFSCPMRAIEVTDDA